MKLIKEITKKIIIITTIISTVAFYYILGMYHWFYYNKIYFYNNRDNKLFKNDKYIVEMFENDSHDFDLLAQDILDNPEIKYISFSLTELGNLCLGGNSLSVDKSFRVCGLKIGLVEKNKYRELNLKERMIKLKIKSIYIINDEDETSIIFFLVESSRYKIGYKYCISNCPVSEDVIEREYYYRKENIIDKYWSSLYIFDEE